MNNKNGFSNIAPIVSKAIEGMKAEYGSSFSLEKINLAELERRTGISRAKLRRMKKNGFVEKPHGLKSTRKRNTLMTGYTAVMDKLLRSGITNSVVCLKRLQEVGFTGGLSTVKKYIFTHKHLVPAGRHLVVRQGNRGIRYSTEPGEAFQMDWGFTKVLTPNGTEYMAACFVMICHHCGQRYVEFFPNAMQENLFIGMIHAFSFMGIPQYVLTDNMKSIVLRRDSYGQPIWQSDYETFMGVLKFKTKLCRPRHPFTKGKVERLVRFVKENFLVGRQFGHITDLNAAVLEWCNEQNTVYHKAIEGIPQEIHYNQCAEQLHELPDPSLFMPWLCPERKISFDGFVNYEGRRFGVPYTYQGKTVRMMRKGDTLYIYSSDMQLLTSHPVTWGHRDSFCANQYAPSQPEELPSTPIMTIIRQLQTPSSDISFEKFNFDVEEDENE